MNLDKLNQVHRDRLVNIKRNFQSRGGFGKVTCPNSLVSFVCSTLDKELSRAGRNAFLSWITDREVSTSKRGVDDGLSEEDGFYLCMWARPAKLSKWMMTSDKWELDLMILRTVFKVEEPQVEIPYDAEAERYKTFFQDI